MPAPKKSNPSHEYIFNTTKTVKKSKCLITDCNEQIAGGVSNLERHLKRKHKGVFADVKEKKQKQEPIHSTTHDQRCETKKIILKVEIDSGVILKSCIELVTVNGRTNFAIQLLGRFRFS
jgi:BED zinc finger